MSELDEAGTALFHQTMPFTKRLGVEVLRHGKDAVVSRLAWEDSLCTLGGMLHGGVLMSLADATAAVCAFLNLPEGAQGTTTIESKTNFLRGLREGYATATSKPLQAGRRVIVVETEIHDDEGRLVAKVTQSQAVL
ncbi:PaaI family thioesterase [Amycolatopsis cynarae]|uniref:PaaI family thioesterase n=1 Tax=Amycolatopsis cynarae TaxID=2995223 RepID=A0ABY7B222_9PSEU|nr:PaaI family thioesterase [Amycolatopsis sp. HUAS 11-8]WAL66349.1 PaaI family thioesterase [Amycolatopsis sp. HUAS 11-8]